MKELRRHYGATSNYYQLWRNFEKIVEKHWWVSIPKILVKFWNTQNFAIIFRKLGEFSLKYKQYFSQVILKFIGKSSKIRIFWILQICSKNFWQLCSEITPKIFKNYTANSPMSLKLHRIFLKIFLQILKICQKITRIFYWIV